MAAYYNEIEPHAAQWLRNLISAGHIAPGEVDERSIEEVSPDDLKGFVQCHFFAGIGGWSYALRLTGFPDDKRAWTGSAPCQPFSSAGAQRGSDDARHLWPAWLRLIEVENPPIIFGEQVAGANGKAWLDHVASDLEERNYAVAAAIMPASSVGALHRRDRLWWVANPERDEQPRQEPCFGSVERMGRIRQSVPWDGDWERALARFRTLGDGIPRCVEGTDAARNAIVPQVAAAFIGACLD